MQSISTFLMARDKMSKLKTNAMIILDKEGVSYLTHSYESYDGAIDGVSVAKKEFKR